MNKKMPHCALSMKQYEINDKLETVLSIENTLHMH
jgi:hypothetical protein